jgi:hypothetical protein
LVKCANLVPNRIGTVTLDGKPVTGALVTFIPTGSTRGKGAYGVTDASGRYELAEDGSSKGVPAGEYRVVCNKWVMPDGSDLPRDSKVAPDEAGAKEFFPRKYSSEAETELRATVSASGGTIDFKLTRK